MQITFLGTSSGVPTRARNVSSIALNLPQRAEVWLFDCGEATQHQLLRCDVKISQIRRIFITHLHGDHIFGLMGLLATYGMAGNPDKIDIYGPKGLDEYLRACQRYSYTHFNYPLKIHTIEPGIVYQEADFTVSCIPLKHKVPAFGYRVAETDRAGRFDVQKAKELGIPSGPIYGKLKNGERVTLADGRVIDGKDLCGETEIGRKFVYCTDTVYCDNAVELAQDADLLVHESTFAHEDADMAFDRLHSTSTMAAQVALSAGVKELILTHFSPRYAPGNAIGLEDLLQTAKAIFPHSRMAHDFMNYEIPRRIEKSPLPVSTEPSVSVATGNSQLPTPNSINYWLMKSEPDVYSIEDLARDRVTIWDGVRNYQARNFLQSMQVNDLVFFYHSNAKPPAIVGLMKVVEAQVVDPSQFDADGEYYDPKSTLDKPRWYTVKVEFVRSFSQPIALTALKEKFTPDRLLVIKPGNRLSVIPIEPAIATQILKSD